MLYLLYWGKHASQARVQGKIKIAQLMPGFQIPTSTGGGAACILLQSIVRHMAGKRKQLFQDFLT
tara:strand:- start:500 stop:694 length:195 start_codon:yes stop_codon:yes gene_type:complete